MTFHVQNNLAARRLRTCVLLPLALLLLTGLGCSVLSSDDDETAVRVQDKHIVVNGVELHYREWGRADASPLLILHGITGHAWEFDSVAAALSDRYRVLAVNQRGHGASTWAEDYSPETMADDIAAFIDALELGPVRIIGHSMGGVNGWWLAACYPGQVERLVTTDVTPDVIANADIVAAFMGVLEAYAQATYANPEEAVTEYLAGYTGAHEQELRTFVLNNLTEQSDGHWTWRFDARGLKAWFEHASADAEAHWAVLRQIACPTLVIRAGDSPFTTAPTAERLADELPGARLVEIPASGHDIHIDQVEALLAELRPFLAGD